MSWPVDGWGDFNVIRFTHEKNKPNWVMKSTRDFGDFVN